MGYLGEARGYNAQTRAGLLTAKDNLSLVQGTARSVVDAIVALDQMGLSQIADGFGMLGQLKDTLGILKSITTPLKDGAVAFAASMPTLISGLQSFSEGITALHEGSQQVSTGIAEIETGSDELSTQMHEGAEAMEMGPREAQAKVAQITSPVVFESSYYTKVANYGTGFAPYFIALGLWVGTLITTFVIRPLNRRMLTQGASPVAAVLSGYFPLALVGICQAVLLLACLQFALKLQVDHVFGYYAFGILTALVFVAIVQFVVFVFGLPGSFACVVLLMLQLTSAAGTFPLETAPRFFQIINPFLPMTYAVSGLRVLTSGVNMDIVWQSTGILALFGLVFLTASCLFAQFKRTVRMTDLYPAFQINK
jgi:putative membrane protein